MNLQTLHVLLEKVTLYRYLKIDRKSTLVIWGLDYSDRH